MRHALALVGLLLLTLGLSGPRVARADSVIDVGGPLYGVRLGAHVALLEDPGQALTFEQVSSPAYQSKFRASRNERLGFGFSESAHWIRMVVTNSADKPRPWLLEVGFPQLDHVTLYSPAQDGGYNKRQTGDMLPFRQRELSYRNFVFMLEEPAQTTRTFYLRVASQGVLKVPLTAWSVEQFAEHQQLDWAGLCVFYGIILMMACYNLSLFGFTRDAEYLRFALFVLSVGAFQMTIVGHTFQFILPNQNQLAQTAVPLSIAVCMVCTSLLGRYQLDAVVKAARERRIMNWVIGLSLLALSVTLLGPFHFSVRFVPLACVTSELVSFTILWRALQHEGRGARLYIWGWSAMLLGAIITLCEITGRLPESFVTQWGAQLGASLQFVLVAAAMATKLTSLRAALRDANEQLAQRVVSLELAVGRAEQATARAERALRVKDEFMATMSHELRTPLNTIINVPQGLVEDFPVQRFAICRGCATRFELEPAERISAESRCPECSEWSTLKLEERAEYTGQPARTTRYLETIERSGKHLLQVVNGILRAERADFADAELSYSIVEVGRLVRDVVDEMGDWAARSGVGLVMTPLSRELELTVDPLRMRQVLLNLIGNAIKFSNGSGTVTVQVREEPSACLLSVSDQGIGIPADKLGTVFDSYQQAHDSDSTQFGGTGLGLSISRSLVQKHGGELWVESELGHGATFTLRIPRARLQRSA